MVPPVVITLTFSIWLPCAPQILFAHGHLNKTSVLLFAMKPTTTAAWFLLLLVGLIPTTATAQSADEITDKNWQSNSKIVAIRKMVNEASLKVKSGAFKTEHRICEEGWFSRLRIARDSDGKVRWYQHYQEGEDSSWDDNYYYDEAGKLRFVVMTSYAANGT